jgi:hypothetical protein
MRRTITIGLCEARQKTCPRRSTQPSYGIRSSSDPQDSLGWKRQGTCQPRKRARRRRASQRFSSTQKFWVASPAT